MIGELHDALYLAGASALDGNLARRPVARARDYTGITSQAPVSVTGWSAVVGGGLALWTLLIALVA
jgi:hypothetical protein